MVPYADYFRFEDKVVLVVGASRGGIGSAIAEAFAAHRARVTITGVEPQPEDAALAHFPYRRLDVADAGEVRALAGAFPRLDVLVNAAGIAMRGEDSALEAFRHVLDVNLVGMFHTCQTLLPQLEQARGSIINIASMYSLFGSPEEPAYGASKAAVAQLTRSLAGKWAPRGVRVNAIAPGFIRTAQSERAWQDAAHREAVNRRTPLARWGLPADIAAAALFLASPGASFVTGTLLMVDGGYSAV